MKYYMYTMFVFFILTTGCEEVPTEVAQNIVGNYKMQTYNTHTGESTPGDDDQLIVTREDDTHVQILIDYQSTVSDDVTLTNVLVSRSGEEYSLERIFSNAEADGNILGNQMTFNVHYETGNFVLITALKE